MGPAGIVLIALAIAIGLIGVVVPLVPGTLLVFAAIAVWAAVEHTVVSWVTLGIVTAVLGGTLLVKYLWPMRRMRSADVGTWSLLAGGALGIVGFFVVPVVGLATAALALREPLTVPVAAASIVVLAGLALVTHAPRRAPDHGCPPRSARGTGTAVSDAAATAHRLADR